MLLCIDVGNTHTVLGLYNESRIMTYWRIATDRAKTTDEYALLIQGLLQTRKLTPSVITDVAISSVVPPLNNALTQLARGQFHVEPLKISSQTKTGITIGVTQPEEVGADRIANAAAAKNKYTLPAIIVDFGTATTFDVISEDAVYLGGAIAPGINISTRALFEHAARLPRVQITPPRRALGRTTIESMQAGILYGAAGGVDKTVHMLKKEVQGEATVVATGGLAETVAPLSEHIQVVDELLTLDGLRYIYDLQRGEKAT